MESEHGPVVMRGVFLFSKIKSQVIFQQYEALRSERQPQNGLKKTKHTADIPL